ncbi:MAG: gliding motility-associated C-terminal domain-containing protein [Bacteroidia bacterium]|nr:gliding motility-associated C-terminal domain-containing protein [Bacteroidia bacterium]
MRFSIKNYLTIILAICALTNFAQTVPSCPSNLIYLHNSPIQAYNPTLPIGPGNPVSTGIPGGGTGLALMPNLNAAAPNPTFYTIIGGNVNWWNGTAWVNTGHAIGNTAAVNMGGCGCYLYSLVGGTGQVYVYNGTGPGTLLTTISTFSGGGPYDIVTDVNCNFYILKTTTGGPGQTLTMYSPTGAVLSTYNMTGMPSTSAGGGFSIIGNTVYVHNTSGFFAGNITGSTVNFTLVPGAAASLGGGDYASCPIGATSSSFTAAATVSGTLGCSTTTVGLSSTTNLTPINTYSWTGPGLVGPTTGSTAVANAPGVYTVVISKTVCPVASVTATVLVTSNGTVINPTITVSNSLTCTNPTAQLTVTPGPPGFSYAWTGPNIIGANNTQVITVGQPGNYVVAVANLTNTCQGSQTLTVVSNTTAPAVMVTPTSTTICFGQSATLVASGASTYTWNTSATTANLTISPTVNTVYSVIGTNAVNGCTNTASGTVNVTPLPIPNANSNSAVCVGNTLNLTGSGGSVYAWQGPNAFISGSQNPSIPAVTAAAAGVYTLTAMVGTCTGSTTTTVVINPLPTPVATNNGPVCVGQAINFTGNGGVSYSWSGPAGFSSNSQNPGIFSSSTSNTGVYVLTVTDANGCINSTATPVVVNALPIISMTSSTICINQNINLGATGGTTYTWSGPGGYTSNAQNPVIPSAQPNMAGVYTVIVTDANNCSSTSNTVVVVNPLPSPTASNNSPVCIGGVFSLVGNGGLTYSWSGPNGFFASSQSPSVIATSANQSGNYTLTVSDNIGCTNTAVTPVTVSALPVANIISSANTGCAPLCVTFTVSSSSSLQTTSWSYNGSNVTNGMNTQYCFNTSGIYTVTADVVDANNCAGSTTFTVDIYPLPVADFNFAPLKPIINIDPEVQFTDASHSANVVTWNWYFMNTAQYTSILQNPTFGYTEPGTYPVALVVKSDHGCIDTIVKPIVVGEDFGIYVPNAFTPNGDGLNDIFQPKGFGVVKYTLMIFDRWGEKLFETSDFNQGWDGTRQSKKDVKYGIIADGTYTWLINCTSVFGKSHELTGHVVLLK